MIELDLKQIRVNRSALKRLATTSFMALTVVFNLIRVVYENIVMPRPGRRNRHIVATDPVDADENDNLINLIGNILRAPTMSGREIPLTRAALAR